MEEKIMPTYNKLVRDKIPTIIEQSGKSFKSRVLQREEYQHELIKSKRRASRIHRSPNASGGN